MSVLNGAPTFHFASWENRRATGHRPGSRSIRRLDTDPVVDRGPDSLFAAEVSLCGLDRDVSGEKLNLFQLPSGRMAQPRARPAKVVRGQLVNAGFAGVLANHMPDRLLR